MKSDRELRLGISEDAIEGEKPTSEEYESIIAELKAKQLIDALTINGLLVIIAGIVPTLPPMDRLFHGMNLLATVEAQMEYLASEEDLQPALEDLAEITEIDLKLDVDGREFAEALAKGSPEAAAILAGLLR